MCTDCHYDDRDEIIEHQGLIEDRMFYLEACAEINNTENLLKDDINSINEAWMRDSWEHDPWIPGED